MERTTCVLYARAGRAALCALLGANDADLSSAAGTSNLLELVDTLHAQRDPLAANSKDHARRLSAVLVMDRTDAGRDYVTRELFDRDDVLKCEEGASYMLTACLQRLFGIDLSKALFLHGASNGGPPFRYFLPRERDDDDPDT